jgi:hypothetical protein
LASVSPMIPALSRELATGGPAIGDLTTNAPE